MLLLQHKKLKFALKATSNQTQRNPLIFNGYEITETSYCDLSIRILFDWKLELTKILLHA